MKKFLAFLFLIPMLSFGQSSWRNGGGGSAPRVQSAPQVRSNSNISAWRSNPPQMQAPRPSYNVHEGYRAPIRYYSFGQYPYWAWSSYSPYYWYDPYGYRYRGRIYHYDNGISDTVKVQPLKMSAGIQTSGDNQVGGWITIGNRGYFITDFSSTFIKDNSTYFPYGKIQYADFPITGTVNRLKTFYLGFGKRTGRTGFHAMLGFVNEDVRYQGKDAIGYITFPKYLDHYMTGKFGIIHDFQTASVKFDYDPFIKSATIGLGVHF
jgi:hypothetical protein